MIAAHSLPATAPGLREAESDGRRIEEISQRLFHASGAPGHFIANEKQLGTSSATYLAPEIVLSPRTPRIGFIHRKLPSGDLYFIANTSNQSHHVQATFRQPAKRVEFLDPFTGGVSSAENSGAVSIDLQRYESRLILLTNSATQNTETLPAVRALSLLKTLDLRQTGS